MEENLSAAWTVARVLKTYPQLAGVFLALKTDCVGCHLNRFCTLQDVAASYGLPLGILLQKLQETR